MRAIDGAGGPTWVLSNASQEIVLVFSHQLCLLTVSCMSAASHYAQKVYGDSRPDVCEIFGGAAESEPSVFSKGLVLF